MADTHTPAPPVAQRIRAAMDAQGMTTRQLAERLGYLRANGKPSSYTYNLLAGHNPLTRSQLQRIATVLTLDPDDLYFDAGVMPPDMEAALTTDRALLRHVRILMNNASRNG